MICFTTLVVIVILIVVIIITINNHSNNNIIADVYIRVIHRLVPAGWPARRRLPEPDVRCRGQAATLALLRGLLPEKVLRHLSQDQRECARYITLWRNLLRNPDTVFSGHLKLVCPAGYLCFETLIFLPHPLLLLLLFCFVSMLLLLFPPIR